MVLLRTSRSTRERGALIALTVAFVVTRAVLGWLADHPETYGPKDTSVVGDPAFYEFWATQVVDDGEHPYSDVRIEYPPGSLPFVLAPELGRGEDDSYRTRFIVLMVVVDAAGLMGLLRLARRRRGWLGCWLWIAALALLGPICYVRLDLVPAVATIWALERADAGSWGLSGAALGFGAMAKVYPAFLFPALLAAARARKAVVGGAAVAVVACALPFLSTLGDLVSSVAGYHLQRGIQVESTWGELLLFASIGGYPIEIPYEFGAFHVSSGISPLLKSLSTISSLGALGAVSWLAWRRLAGPSAGAAPARATELPGILYGLLGILLVTGSVLSPQFLIWAAALGAAALTLSTGPGRWIALLLTAAALSQLIYPFAYNSLLRAEPPAVLLLAARNLLLAVSAGGALAASLRGVAPRRDRPATELAPAPASGGPQGGGG